MFRLSLRIALILSFIFVKGVLAEVVSSTRFSASSAGDVRGLNRLSSDASGLNTPSLYRDPRAWAERLEPATIGTVGTGIGVGDFNGDGWPDLFVGIREEKNRLYLNDGGKRFVDKTEEAGILESLDWTTGVTVADINGDRLPDIYVCFFDAPNRLYLNRGDAVFEEVAGKLGLNIKDSSSGAFFADYDKDGDLDLYLQTNYKNQGSGEPDYFLRNDGDDGFTDITAMVGIIHGPDAATFGHSVLWVDYDEDGWEDIYVANDFRAPDFLYLNNGDGTFRAASEILPIVPYSSMGSDLGDVNNDGRIDILTTDMATTSYRKHVESMLTNGTKTRDLPEGSLPRQVMKNALLLNRGPGDYVDVAYAWNLAATDWTWAPRLVDLDNDGWQDAFFSNGMIRQFHNADLALAQDRQTSIEAKNTVFERSPILKERNLVFRNQAGRGFEAANALWSFEHEGVSFGTALLDFDCDGDLDIVYTNYNAAPALWRNDLGTGNAVQVKLVGKGKNTEAIGAVGVAHFGDQALAQKILSNRGYLGTDEKLLHFGLEDRDEM
ncbi:MAG: VCBS repeat-containing protein, partial [Verrucomicrobiae bacterium]|nr:VCBS repeat-containing protein [Verrucomicrobiae bacterium]